MESFIISFKKNYKGIILISIAALFTSIGQLLWKISNGKVNGFMISGFLCYGLGAILMIIAFRFGSLSVLHPMLSLSYIFAIIFGAIFLGEYLNFVQFIAVIVIIIGVVLIGGGDVK